jgi:drug/metabolite transporter (DMT)-like permease
MHYATLGHLAQLVSITVWTVGLVVQKWLTPHADIAGILLVQFALAALVLWTGLAATGRLPRLDRSVLKPLVWGMFAPGLVLLLSIAGAARTDPVSLTLAWGLIPLLVPVLARLLLGEPLHWSFPVAGLVGLTGAAALLGDRIALGVGDLLGNILVIAGVGCGALSQVIGRRLNDGRRPWFQTATLQVTGAALVCAALAAARGADLPTPSDPAQLAAAGYLVLAMTVLNFLAFNLALTRLRAAWVAIYASLSPAIGALAGALLLGSPLRPTDGLWIAVMVAAVALPHLLQLPGQRRRQVDGGPR